MNKFIGMGRLTADPRITTAQTGTKIARYNIAIDRYVKDGEPQADFIGVVAFGAYADFAEKYLHKGMKILVTGRLQTGSYEKDGVRHYTTDVIAESQEFCESKGNSDAGNVSRGAQADEDGFVNIPDGLDDEGLPWN